MAAYITSLRYTEAVDVRACLTSDDQLYSDGDQWSDEEVRKASEAFQRSDLSITNGSCIKRWESRKLALDLNGFIAETLLVRKPFDRSQDLVATINFNRSFWLVLVLLLPHLQWLEELELDAGCIGKFGHPGEVETEFVRLVQVSFHSLAAKQLLGDARNPLPKFRRLTFMEFPHRIYSPLYCFDSVQTLTTNSTEPISVSRLVRPRDNPDEMVFLHIAILVLVHEGIRAKEACRLAEPLKERDKPRLIIHDCNAVR